MTFCGLSIATAAVPGVCDSRARGVRARGDARCGSAAESAVSCFCKGLFLLVVVVKTNMWENNGIFFFLFSSTFLNTIKKPIKIKCIVLKKKGYLYVNEENKCNYVNTQSQAQRSFAFLNLSLYFCC